MPVNVALVLGYDALGGVSTGIQAAKAASLTPILILNENNADYSDLLPERLILKSANVNRDHRALVREIHDMAQAFGGRRIRVRAILNNQDRMWLCYLDLKKAFPAACGIPRDQIIKTSIKPNFRFCLRHTRFHVPYVLLPKRYALEERPLDFAPLRLFTGKLTGAIVKPVVGSGSLGVAYVKKGAAFSRDLGQAVKNALEAQRRIYSGKISANFLEFGAFYRAPVNDYVLIEQYIDGVEYSLEGIATDFCEPNYFVMQTKTRTVKKPVFRDLQYLAHPAAPAPGIAKATSKLLAATNFKTFPFHIELKDSKKHGLKPIEFNPRIGGGSITDLVMALHSVDLRKLSVKAVLDEVQIKRSFVTVVVQPQKAGRIVRYCGLGHVQQQTDCIFLKKLVPEGSEIGHIDRENYLVEFCIVGKDPKSAQRRANDLLNRISVEVE